MPVKLQAEVYHNTKEKIYRSGLKRITVCSKPIFKDEYWELVDDKPKEKVSKPKKMDNEVRNDSMKRAKEKVFDISIQNDFDYFITWTLDSEKVDRTDPKEVSKKLRNFLHNMQKRYNLKYLIIPEYHKDEKGIHMHGLISGDIKLVNSGHKTKLGKTIYNMPQWTLGFSTAIELTGDVSNVAKYITKYISKDFRKIFGSFYYAGGAGLVRSPAVRLYDSDYMALDEKEFSIVQANLGFKYLVVDSEGVVS